MPLLPAGLDLLMSLDPDRPGLVNDLGSAVWAGLENVQALGMKHAFDWSCGRAGLDLLMPLGQGMPEFFVSLGAGQARTC